MEESRHTEETPAFVDIGGERLFSILHRPAAAARGGFLFCHALGEEKLWSHRVLVSFARRLAAGGWTVLRIDHRGEGDSDRSFEQSDVGTRVADAIAGLAVLRAGLPAGAPVGVLGLRFGATIAALVASEPDSRVDHLVLWEPVVRGAPYMQSVLMINLAFQMALERRIVLDRQALADRLRNGETVNIEGYCLSRALFEQANRIDLARTLAGFRGRGLVVQVAAANATPSKEMQELTRCCAGLQFQRVAEEPFWKEIKTYYQQADELANATCRWLEESAWRM